MINLCPISDSLKIQNRSNFYFEKRTAKKHKFSIVLKVRYFVTGGPYDMNVDVF